MEKAHVDVKNVSSSNQEPLIAEDSGKLDDKSDGEDQSDGEEYSESNSLLPPRKGGMSRKSDKTRRKVQWNDRNGNKLVEVLEFEPSDVSDSDDEESDSCICTIMSVGQERRSLMFGNILV